MSADQQGKNDFRKTKSSHFFIKIFITLFIALACALLLFIALLPTLASSGWTKDKLLAIANGQIPGSVSIEKVSLNWLGPQEIQGVILKDPQGEVVVSLQKGMTQSSLFHLLWNKIGGSFEVESLNGILATDSSGTTNIEKALNKECCQIKSSEGSLPAVVAFKNVNAHFNLGVDNSQPLTMRLTGETLQDQLSGQFVVDGELKGVDIDRLLRLDQKTIDYLRFSPHAELKIKADISNLPVAILDQFIALKQPELKGILGDLIGQNLNLIIDQTATSQGVAIVLNAKSPLLSAAVEATAANNISLLTPAVFTLKITPALIEKLATIAQPSSPWRLLSPTTAELVIDHFQFPLNLMEGKTLKELDLTQLDLSAKLSLQPTTVRGDETIGNIDLQQLIATFGTEAGQKTGTITLNGEAKQNGQPFKINLGATVPKPAKWEDLSDIFDDFQRHISVEGDVKGLPIIALDTHLGMNGTLLTALGNTIEMGFTLQSVENKSLATISLKSDSIEIPPLSFWLGKELVLNTPAIAQLRFSSALVNQIIFNGSLDSPRFEDTVSAEIKLHRFSMPLVPNKADSHKVLIDANIAFSPLVVGQIPTIDNVSLNDFNIHINATSLSAINCSVSSTLSQRNCQGVLCDALGAQTKVTSLTTLRLSSNRSPEIGSVDVQIVSDLAKLNLTGEMKENNALAFKFNGSANLGKQQGEGNFSGDAIIHHWLHEDKHIDFSQAKLRLNGKTHKLPTKFIAAFIKDNDLTPLLGNFIDTHIAADIALSSAQGTVAFDVSSENLTGSFAINFDSGISLNHSSKPAIFNLLLTPQGYSALRHQINPDSAGDFTLAEPTQITMQLNMLNIPWPTSPSQAMSSWKSAIGIDVSIDKLVGIDKKTQHKVTFNAIQGNILSQDISKHTAFNIHGEGQTNQGLPTALNLVGALEKGFNTDGSINRRDLSLALDASVNNLPVPMLCQLACLNPQMSQKVDAIIGNALNAKIKAKLQHMNGPIYLELSGKNGHTILDAQLTNGNLTLNNNFYAELTVTPQLGKHVLEDLIPFLSGILGSDQPLKLTIAREGFILPLRQFSIENVSINEATLELGKVRFSNQGQLAKILSLLTTATANEIMVWLTPSYFSLSHGVFKLERVDMLISDRYPIAAWGKVDIGNDNVNMAIGLSGAAISKAFNVSGIKKKYMLQLPLRGTMSHASIDKSKAVARLSALVAQSQGGPHGLVLGTVLDIATGGLTEESPPEPSTNPLPWSHLMEETTNSDSESQAGLKNSSKSELEKVIPIDEIGKGAGKLIKKLFK